MTEAAHVFKQTQCANNFVNHGAGEVVKKTVCHGSLFPECTRRPSTRCVGRTMGMLEMNKGQGGGQQQTKL